jgi:DNA topoisomerase VI subunit B
MSTAILERQHFTVSQECRYFDPAKLAAMIGQEQSQWRHAALKEMVDNALDAAESVYPAIAPAIEIQFTETENGLILSVADNGPGIPAEAVPRIAELSSNSSTKLFYRAPLRGARKATPSKP